MPPTFIIYKLKHLHIIPMLLIIREHYDTTICLGNLQLNPKQTVSEQFQCLRDTSSEPSFKMTINKYLLISDLSNTWEGEVKNENDKEEYFPIFKKANVVGRVLQKLDSNV